MSRPLMELVFEAVRLGGGNLCASGHEWKEVGGKVCRHSHLMGDCSESVFKCERCGEYDYGTVEPPDREECEQFCPTSKVAQATQAAPVEGEPK